MGQKNLKLKARIIEKFGTQYRFAAAVECDPCVVSGVINGHRLLPASKKARWAIVLDVDPKKIFFTVP